jgi:hypothetical protein
MLKLREEIRKISQTRVQDEINMITKEKMRLVQIECKWYGGLNKNNFMHKPHMAYNLWEEAPLPSL